VHNDAVVATIVLLVDCEHLLVGEDLDSQIEELLQPRQHLLDRSSLRAISHSMSKGARGHTNECF